MKKFTIHTKFITVLKLPPLKINRRTNIKLVIINNQFSSYFSVILLPELNRAKTTKTFFYSCIVVIEYIISNCCAQFLKTMKLRIIKHLLLHYTKEIFHWRISFSRHTLEYTMFFQSASVQRSLVDPSLIGMKSSTIWTI